MQEVHRTLIVIDVPTNLGLRRPQPGREPGVKHMAGALRRWDINERLGAIDGGIVFVPPYDHTWYPGYGTSNAEAIRHVTLNLAEWVGGAVDDGRFPVVLGGDCSILLGNVLALRRRGRYGLVYIDGHLDFRHPGNSAAVEAVAGEDLALVTGRGSERLANIDGLSPYMLACGVVLRGVSHVTTH